MHGAAGFKEEFGGAGAAGEDRQYALQEQLAEGDRVAARFTARGTHRQEFGRIAPTGRPTEVEGLVIYRVANGKIVDYRLSYDRLTLLEQLGATITPPRQAGG